MTAVVNEAAHELTALHRGRDADAIAAPMLRVEGVVRRFAGRPVVDGVSLDIDAGEQVVLVGPSGCGKSTLLRTIAGLDRADEGRIVLDGRDVSAVPAERRRVGLVFQDHALFGHLRVADNIAFGLKDLSRRERSARVAELLDLVQLSKLARRYPHELSGGEQQRVALARALAPRPAVVLLDEPFASLDERLRDELRGDVTAVLRDEHATALFVTHDRTEALAVGDRLAVMRDGRLIQVDRPQVVFDHPADRFTADFMATTSFLPAEDGGVYAARPHQLAVERGGADRVISRTYLGGGQQYLVRRSDGTEVVAGVAPDGPLESGDPCTIRTVATLHHLPPERGS